MAPRTWSAQDSVTANSTNLVTLVLEDSELFEAEAAELNIEDSDDSSSLLIRNDGNSGGDIALTDQVAYPRSPSLALSVHSLATTTIVVPTLHAQTIEFSLTAIPVQIVAQSSQQSNIQHTEFCEHFKKSSTDDDISLINQLDACHYHFRDFIRSLPVHILNAVNHGQFHQSPAMWPRCVLAYTDAPAFVKAVNADMNCLADYMFGCKIGQNQISIILTSCDLASDQTTCELSCCQAGVELLECCYHLSSENDDNASTSSLTNAQNRSTDFTQKRLYKAGCLTPDQVVTLKCDGNRLYLDPTAKILICPYSGLRPDLLKVRHSVPSNLTAVYMLLVMDDSDQQQQQQQQLPQIPSKRTCLFSHDRSFSSQYSADGQTGTNGMNSNSTLILASLVHLMPYSHHTNPDNLRIQINHHLHCSTRISLGETFSALLAVVDLSLSFDDFDQPQLKAIIHQRLHYVPEFKFKVNNI